jgi:uncharacterized protein
MCIIMSLRSDIVERQKTAMKEKDVKTLSTIRMLVSGIKNAEIDKKRELTDDEVIVEVKRQVKQLKDSLKDISAGGREDMVTDIESEVAILSEYLPEEMSDEDLEKVVRAVVDAMGISGKSEMGKVMGRVMKDVAGRADGGRVRVVVERLLVSDEEIS